MIFQKLIKSQSGFSLVELLVAAVILAIVAAGFIGLYTTGVFGVASAGLRSRNISLTQEELERKINSGTTVEDPLTITFPSDNTTININGEYVVYSNENVTIRAFIPRR
jgi:prepilin-type N-terminal cleavage/methylation domain-containing protein